MPGSALGPGERTEGGLGLHFVGRIVEPTGLVSEVAGKEKAKSWMNGTEGNV